MSGMKTVEINNAFTVRVFLALDSDGETAATGLVDGDFTSKQFAKSTGGFGAIAGTITEVAFGWYDVPFTAGEADTAGEVLLHLEAPGVVTLDDKVAQVIVASVALADLVIRSGTAQAGASGSITLDAGASASNNLYNGLDVAIVSGTGAGQARVIRTYVGATKVATVENAWAVNPDATSVFRLLAATHPLVHSDGSGTLSAYASAVAVWNAAVDDAGLDPGSYGELLRIILAMSNGMLVMDNTTHDANGLTAARFRVFDSAVAVAAATDGGSGEGEIAIFEIGTTYDAPGQVNVYRARRTS